MHIQARINISPTFSQWEQTIYIIIHFIFSIQSSLSDFYIGIQRTRSFFHSIIIFHCWVYHYVFIPSPIDWHSLCFRCVATRNNAAVYNLMKILRAYVGVYL